MLLLLFVALNANAAQDIAKKRFASPIPQPELVCFSTSTAKIICLVEQPSGKVKQRNLGTK